MKVLILSQDEDASKVSRQAMAEAECVLQRSASGDFVVLKHRYDTVGSILTPAEVDELLLKQHEHGA